MTTRRATHAGSWYTERQEELAAQLAGWLQQADECCGTARAIIAPHAGYSYSGPTAAWAYKHVQPAGITRVFIVGPSHHYYTPRCCVSGCATYATPLGDLALDTATADELRATGAFDVMDVSVDEAEHSIEMHLPYVVHVMGHRPFRIVPVLVGALDEHAEAEYGRLLAPYLLQPETLFIISSDFCHWGRRFKFTHQDPSAGEIFQSIEALDRKGMALIEAQDADGFARYQHTFHNTICGRHPIALLLHALEQARAREARHELRFVRCVSKGRLPHASCNAGTPPQARHRKTDPPLPLVTLHSLSP